MKYATLALAALVCGWLAVNVTTSPTAVAAMTIVGVTSGCLYALAALGYTLVYEVLDLINLPHGYVFVLGGLLTAQLLEGHVQASSSVADKAAWLVLALAVSVATCAVLSAVIELVAFRRLRQAPRLAPLVTSVAVIFILSNVMTAVWNASLTLELPPLLPQRTLAQLGTVQIRLDKVAVAVAVAILLALTRVVLYRTSLGKQMRAAAEDREAAALVGINVNRAISLTFLLGGALAGAGGTIFALYVTSISWDEGLSISLIAFTAAVVGGLARVEGAVLGAILIGLVGAYNEGLRYTPGSEWTQSVILLTLIVILVVRPQGLLAE